MTPSQRILINTVSQYIRTVINIVLSLYTVRLVLASLGQSDYGLYSLIAGVVAMLSFITNSLVNTTQRFVSFYQGKGNLEKLKEVFNNSLLIHIILGLLVVFLLEAFIPILFNGFLNIPAGRESSAIVVYHLVVVMLFITFITSPYRALLVSHENIVYISIVDILDAILKVVLVLIMTISNSDKLVFYSYIMMGVQLFNFIMLSVYCYVKYEECIYPNFFKLTKAYVKELGVYAGWHIYGTMCIAGRNQGISIILNKAFGTMMNAAWGIGMQISGYTNFLSTAVVNAMAPQIVKAEGGCDRERSIYLSCLLSKINFFLMSVIAYPILFEIDTILALWLGTPPNYSSFFGKVFIIALLFDSLTIGLTHLNNAIGKIGFYTFVMSTPKFLTFVVTIFLVRLNTSLLSIGITYIVIEALCAFIRIPMICRQSGLDIKVYMNTVIGREILPSVICVFICWFCLNFIEIKYRFVATFILSTVVYSNCFYLLGLTGQEKMIVQNLKNNFLTKLGYNKLI